MLIWAPELWPETAREWYAKYEEQFWQQGRWFAGFREYPKDVDVGWFALDDVDSGPVVGGYGAAASAFGIGAARAMGRFDHAYTLAAQAIVGSWPLPNGTLLGPRMLSNISDAPYLGEAAVLFVLTRGSVDMGEVAEQGKLPLSVYVVITLFICLGVYEVLATIYRTWRWHKRHAKMFVPLPGVQVSVWLVLITSAVLTWTTLSVCVGLIILLTTQLIPFRVKKRSHNSKMCG